MRVDDVVGAYAGPYPKHEYWNERGSLVQRVADMTAMAAHDGEYCTVARTRVWYPKHGQACGRPVLLADPQRRLTGGA